MSLINSVISIISILISVAFYTILERKILSYIQIRKGPNKVGFMGILQPFSDAIKLFNKNLNSPELMNMYMYLLSPSASLILAMILMSIIPLFLYPNTDIKHSIIAFMVISSLNVYTILLIGWSSNSKFAYLGAIRSLAQMISYEISFFLIILFTALMSNSYNFTQMSETQVMLWFFMGHFLILIMWLISCLAEVNRSPYDFAESESELVSGFNVEYMGGLFALIFLAEYSMMIILSILSIAMFFFSMKSYLSVISISMITIFMLWARGTLPRFRYDLLMYMSWKTLLPSILVIIPLPLMISLLSI